jgi:hypothetical protein
MKRVLAIVCGLLVLLMAPAAAWAKGDMVLIEIRGGNLTAPLKITDPKIQEFSVWAGPGVNGSTVENAEGFIADWRKGAVAQPADGVPRYELSFYAGCRTAPSCLGETPILVYVVSYAYDASSKRGYIYLPGTSRNVSTIYHGKDVEGRWFPATYAWEQFVRPRIAAASRHSAISN